MPEIWLPYGSNEVVINIKAENLAETFDVRDKPLQEEEVLNTLRQVERPQAVVSDGTTISRGILERLNRLWGDSTGLLNVVELKGWQNGEADSAPTDNLTDVGVVDGVLVRAPASLLNSEPLLIASCVYDPVFGFKGPDLLLTQLTSLEGEAMKRWDKRMSPGEDTDPGWFARKVSECFQGLKSITSVPTAGGLAMVSYGDVRASSEGARSYIKVARMREVRPSRLTIVGCGGSDYDSTLGDSLRVVGNHTAALQEDSEVIIAAECSDGLGSSRLRDIVDGAQGGRSGESVEELVLKEIQNKATVHLVSTLPKSIVEKRLKLKAHSSLREAFESIEARHSWRLKTNIIARAPLLASRPVAEPSQP
jgi:uncharacterized membrane protein